MKTPEEYLKQATSKTEHFPAHGDKLITQTGAIAALKAMQSDHEKELIEFAEYSDIMETSEAKYDWLLLSTMQRIEQFRNKQQDR